MNDLLYRQDVIDHIRKRLYETAWNTIDSKEEKVYRELANNRVKLWLEDLPSVTEQTGMYGCNLINGHIVCLNCLSEYDYCPKCGSKMSTD